MFLPATYRDIGYYDSVALIKKSHADGESIRTHDVAGKPIIYRVKRIKNPTEKQLPAEQVFASVTARERPKKEMILVHGTASGVVGVEEDNEEKKDLSGFNTLYRTSDAAYCITSK